MHSAPKLDSRLSTLDASSLPSPVANPGGADAMGRNAPVRHRSVQAPEALPGAREPLGRRFDAERHVGRRGRRGGDGESRGRQAARRRRRGDAKRHARALALEIAVQEQRRLLQIEQEERVQGGAGGRGGASRTTRAGERLIFSSRLPPPERSDRQPRGARRGERRGPAVQVFVLLLSPNARAPPINRVLSPPRRAQLRRARSGG